MITAMIKKPTEREEEAVDKAEASPAAVSQADANCASVPNSATADDPDRGESPSAEVRNERSDGKLQVV